MFVVGRILQIAARRDTRDTHRSSSAASGSGATELGHAHIYNILVIQTHNKPYTNVSDTTFYDMSFFRRVTYCGRPLDFRRFSSDRFCRNTVVDHCG